MCRVTKQPLGLGATRSAAEGRGKSRARDGNDFWAEGRQQEGRGQMIWP